MFICLSVFFFFYITLKTSLYALQLVFLPFKSPLTLLYLSALSFCLSYTFPYAHWDDGYGAAA